MGRLARIPEASTPMFTNRRNQRNRREALLTLESLDERLVLSATAAAAIGPHTAAVEQGHEAMIARDEAKLARVEVRHEAQAARVEARHEARLARVESRHAARLARMALPAVAAPMIPATMTPAATTSTSASAAASTPASPVGMTTTTTTTPATTMYATTNTPASTAASSSSSTSFSTTASTGSSTLPSNVDANLQSLYSEYESAGGGTDFKPSQASDKLLQISGTSVAVSLKINSPSSFSSAMSTLKAAGMQVTASSSTYGLIDGMLPIAKLPAAASVASSVNASPPPNLFL